MGDSEGTDSVGGPLDWDDLRVFLYAAERESIRAAARELGISQPTASQRIRALEAKLGVKLFVRRANGILLTDAGRETLEHARAVHREFVAIDRNLRMRDKRAQGRVRLAASDGLAGMFIGPRLAGFYRNTHGILLTMDAGTWPNDPLRDEVDLSIQYENREQDDYVAEVLGFAHYAPFVSRSFIAKHGMPKSVEEIARLPRLNHVAYSRQRETWDPVIPAAFSQTPETMPVFETNSSLALHSAVRAGLGSAFMPTWSVAGDENLVMLTPGPLASLKIWLVYHEEIGQIERVRLVIDWLRSIYDADENPCFREAFVHPDMLTKR